MKRRYSKRTADQLKSVKPLVRIRRRARIAVYVGKQCVGTFATMDAVTKFADKRLAPHIGYECFHLPGNTVIARALVGYTGNSSRRELSRQVFDIRSA